MSTTTQEQPHAAAAAPAPARPAPLVPLRLNLLHEQQSQLQERQRDPLKLGLFVLAAIAALMVAVYLFHQLSSGALEGQRQAKQAEWTSKYERPVKDATARDAEVKRINNAAAALTRRIENRVYWAPILETLTRTIPPEVQLTSLNGSSEGREKTQSTVSLTLDGIAAGPQPREVAEKLRFALIEQLGRRYQKVQASYRSLEETRTSVTLAGKGLPTAKFTMTISFADTFGAPVPTPAPAAPPAKK